MVRIFDDNVGICSHRVPDYTFVQWVIPNSRRFNRDAIRTKRFSEFFQILFLILDYFISSFFERG